MKNRSIEAKVGASSLAVFIVNGVFAFAAYYHWFTPPPSYLTLVVATVATLVAGYLAPHTSRPKLLTPAEIALLDEKKSAAAAFGTKLDEAGFAPPAQSPGGGTP